MKIDKHFLGSIISTAFFVVITIYGVMCTPASCPNSLVICDFCRYAKVIGFFMVSCGLVCIYNQFLREGGDGQNDNN